MGKPFPPTAFWRELGKTFPPSPPRRVGARRRGNLPFLPIFGREWRRPFLQTSFGRRCGESTAPPHTPRLGVSSAKPPHSNSFWGRTDLRRQPRLGANGKDISPNRLWGEGGCAFPPAEFGRAGRKTFPTNRAWARMGKTFPSNRACAWVGGVGVGGMPLLPTAYGREGGGFSAYRDWVRVEIPFSTYRAWG